MKVAIAGATGLTGSLCLQELIKNKNISEIFAIGRKPTGIINSKLKEIELKNFQSSEIITVDAFICCIGTTIKKAKSKEAFMDVDLHLPVSIAKKLQENGCKIMSVISAMGADTNSYFFYNRVKGMMEQEIKNLNFESVSILRPSLIIGHRKEKRTGEKMGIVFMKIMNPLLFGKLKNYRSIKALQISKALVNTILKNKPGYNIYLSEKIKRL